MLAIACGCLAIPAPAARAATGRGRVGSAPALPRGAAVTGSLAPERELRLTVMLEPRDPSGLEALATAVSTPGSPSFRRYVGVGEFADRFGAPPGAVAAVGAALRAQGLQVGEIAVNRLTLPVTGTAAAVEAAFDAPLRTVRLPSGRMAFANARAPSVPAAVAPDIQGVIGLDDLHPVLPVSGPVVRRSRSHAGASAPRSAARTTAGAAGQIATGGPQPCAEATFAAASQDTYTLDELAAAYEFPGLYGLGDLGTGQTIAVTEIGDAHLPSDIAAFQACYGTHAQVTSVPVAGGLAPGLSLGEATLDIETIIGLAPGAKIDVYETEPQSLVAFVEVDSAIVSQDVAKTISNSYGLCEEAMGFAVVNAENTLLQEAAVQGQTFLTASGDNGSQSCSRISAEDTELTALDPASQPFATAVGGTTLTAVGPPAQETLWNEGSNATGGGISSDWPMPAYQASALPGLGVLSAESSGAPCASVGFCREVPDISADAGLLGGYTVLNNGEWVAVGGTSAATPLWAAMTSLVDAALACRGRGVGFINPALYRLAGANYTGNFLDITRPSPQGLATNDTLFEGLEPYPVKPGYDMTTGLGSPIASDLAASFCALVSPAYAVGLTPPAEANGTVGSPLTLRVDGTDSGNLPLTYAATGLPAGLSLNPATGVIAGVPQAPGQSTISVSATDAYANGAATSFTLTVAEPPSPPPPPPVRRHRKKLKLSKAKLKGVARHRPRLSLILTAVGRRNRYDRVTMKLGHGLWLAHARRALAHGVLVENRHGRAIRVRVKVKRGRLVLRFAHRRKETRLIVRFPTLRSKRALSRQVRRHKVKRVKLIVSAKGKSRTNSVRTRLRAH